MLPPGVGFRTVRLVHTSDVHIGNGIAASGEGFWPELSMEFLDRIVTGALQSNADAILISGDLFDHNRVSATLSDGVTRILERARMPVVVLPGNHDPYTRDSVYRRMSRPSNLHILSSPHGELISLPGTGIQVWGQAHADYEDFSPFAVVPRWCDDIAPMWRVALGHGLYVRSEYEKNLSYQICDDELEKLGAHYVGLGHLEHHEAVGTACTTAYYAGAPERSGTMTVVEMSARAIAVTTALLAGKRPTQESCAPPPP